MTKKLYDMDSHLRSFSAQVLSCRFLSAQRWEVLLDKTAFFPEGGGQPADRGTLGGARVLDVQETPQGILHITDGPLAVGVGTHGTIDWPLRFRRMQCHSGEHILSGLAHRLYGCTNVGFHLGDDEVILDFDKELTEEQLMKLENEANAIIVEDRPVKAEYPPDSELKTLNYRSKLALTKNVRIVSIEGCDTCACCAPHVYRTGEIGMVKILSSMRHRGGIRLWMAAGSMALADYRTKQNNIAAISAALSVKQQDAALGVERMKQELQEVKQQLSEARRALAEAKCAALPETQGNLCLFEEDLDSQGMRTMVNTGMEKCTGLCAVFSGSDKTGYQYVMGSKTLDLKAAAKAINAALDGKGGGKKTMIQGSAGADRDTITRFFAHFPD